MAKFINFDSREFDNRNGWHLLDISVNVDAISIVMHTTTVHTFSKYDIDKGITETFGYHPCTILVTHDGTELTVLGSYDDTLSKINGVIKNEKK